MTAFNEAFRSEIVRIARKEIKGEIASVRKSLASLRGEIVLLKREMKVLHAQVKTQSKALGRQEVRADARDPATREDQKHPGNRREKDIAVQLLAKREYFGFTQAEMAQVLEASSLSVGRWETGKVQPRAAQLERIGTVLKMGKRAARAKLAIESQQGGVWIAQKGN